MGRARDKMSPLSEYIDMTKGLEQSRKEKFCKVHNEDKYEWINPMTKGGINYSCKSCDKASRDAMRVLNKVFSNL